MRQTGCKSITGNRATVNISQTVYDRRALDNISDLPLISSLNHLAFLCSTSTLIREAMSHDGALERLVSILQECYIPITDLPHILMWSKKDLNPLQTVKRDRKLAYLSWKWTLAYQCIVLTGTRGTLSIRENVVNSGIIPVIATVLDNYMIYYNNFDFVNKCTIPFSFSEIADVDTEFFKFTEEELQALNCKVDKKDPYYEKFIAMERLKILLGEQANQFDFDVENVAGVHLEPNILTELDTDWLSLAQDDVNFSLSDSCLENVVISPPRKFFLGRVIPEMDDLTWGVQLLAFLTKNTAVKPILQNTKLVDSLSFRPILENVKARLAKSVDLNITLLSLQTGNNAVTDVDGEDEEIDEEIDEPNEDNMDLSPDITLIEKYFKDIQPLCVTKDSHSMINSFYDDTNNYNNNNNNNTNNTNNTNNNNNTVKISNNKINNSNIITEDNSSFNRLDIRLQKEESLKRRFYESFQKNNFSTELNDNDWERIFKNDTLNLFALVERFTVKGFLNDIIHYWSSVVMRNSCRKHESMGVRQCANFSCGKWEDHPKQFPKCRRCKRTKYCSRLCQLKSWEFHRYWCQEANSVSTTGNSTATNTENSTGTHTPYHTTADSSDTEFSNTQPASMDRTAENN